MNPHNKHSTTGISGVPDYETTILGTSKHEIALVIPVLNENGRITHQLEKIRDFKPSVDVIIADGGSSDGSTNPSILHELGVTTLLTKIGPGKLSAQLRMSIHHCMESNYSAIITMDGNDKDGVEGISVIEQALRDGFDFVQGSRFVTGGRGENTPLIRLLAIKLLHAPITSLGARFWFTDTTNGFRGHSRRFLSDSRVAPLRDVFDTYELLAYLPIQASRLGFKVSEVPVMRSYPINEPTPTKISGMTAHLEMLKILFNAARGKYNPASHR